MKYVKMLGLLAVAATALMAFAAATASATTLTGEKTGEIYTGTITATSEGTTKLDGSFVTVECGHSHVSGKVEQHGNAITAGGKISSLTFNECNYATTVVKAGSLEIHTDGSHTNETTGLVTSTGAEISIATSVGTCVFTTNGTPVGTFTGTEDTKATATLDIASAKIPRTGGSFLCGSSGTWTGSYEIITPDSLWLDATV